MTPQQDYASRLSRAYSQPRYVFVQPRVNRHAQQSSVDSLPCQQQNLQQYNMFSGQHDGVFPALVSQKIKTLKPSRSTAQLKSGRSGTSMLSRKSKSQTLPKQQYKYQSSMSPSPGDSQILKSLPPLVPIMGTKGQVGVIGRKDYVRQLVGRQKHKQTLSQPELVTMQNDESNQWMPRKQQQQFSEHQSNINLHSPLDKSVLSSKKGGAHASNDKVKVKCNLQFFLPNGLKTPINNVLAPMQEFLPGMPIGQLTLPPQRSSKRLKKVSLPTSQNASHIKRAVGCSNSASAASDNEQSQNLQKQDSVSLSQSQMPQTRNEDEKIVLDTKMSFNNASPALPPQNKSDRMENKNNNPLVSANQEQLIVQSHVNMFNPALVSQTPNSIVDSQGKRGNLGSKINDILVEPQQQYEQANLVMKMLYKQNQQLDYPPITTQNQNQYGQQQPQQHIQVYHEYNDQYKPPQFKQDLEQTGQSDTPIKDLYFKYNTIEPESIDLLAQVEQETADYDPTKDLIEEQEREQGFEDVRKCLASLNNYLMQKQHQIEVAGGDNTPVFNRSLYNHNGEAQVVEPSEHQLSQCYVPIDNNSQITASAHQTASIKVDCNMSHNNNDEKVRSKSQLSSQPNNMHNASVSVTERPAVVQYAEMATSPFQSVNLTQNLDMAQDFQHVDQSVISSIKQRANPSVHATLENNYTPLPPEFRSPPLPQMPSKCEKSIGNQESLNAANVISQRDDKFSIKGSQSHQRINISTSQIMQEITHQQYEMHSKYDKSDNKLSNRQEESEYQHQFGSIKTANAEKRKISHDQSPTQQPLKNLVSVGNYYTSKNRNNQPLMPSLSTEKLEHLNGSKNSGDPSMVSPVAKDNQSRRAAINNSAHGHQYQRQDSPQQLLPIEQQQVASEEPIAEEQDFDQSAPQLEEEIKEIRHNHSGSQYYVTQSIVVKQEDQSQDPSPPDGSFNIAKTPAANDIEQINNQPVGEPITEMISEQIAEDETHCSEQVPAQIVSENISANKVSEHHSEEEEIEEQLPGYENNIQEQSIHDECQPAVDEVEPEDQTSDKPQTPSNEFQIQDGKLSPVELQALQDQQSAEMERGEQKHLSGMLQSVETNPYEVPLATEVDNTEVHSQGKVSQAQSLERSKYLSSSHIVNEIEQDTAVFKTTPLILSAQEQECNNSIENDAKLPYGLNEQKMIKDQSNLNVDNAAEGQFDDSVTVSPATLHAHKSSNPVMTQDSSPLLQETDLQPPFGESTLSPRVQEQNNSIPVITEIVNSGELSPMALKASLEMEEIKQPAEAQPIKDSQQYVIDWSKATFHNSNADQESHRRDEELKIEDHAVITIQQNASNLQLHQQPSTDESPQNPFIQQSGEPNMADLMGHNTGSRQTQQMIMSEIIISSPQTPQTPPVQQCEGESPFNSTELNQRYEDLRVVRESSKESQILSSIPLMENTRYNIQQDSSISQSLVQQMDHSQDSFNAVADNHELQIVTEEPPTCNRSPGGSQQQSHKNLTDYQNIEMRIDEPELVQKMSSEHVLQNEMTFQGDQGQEEEVPQQMEIIQITTEEKDKQIEFQGSIQTSAQNSEVNSGENVEEVKVQDDLTNNAADDEYEEEQVDEKSKLFAKKKLKVMKRRDNLSKFKDYYYDLMQNQNKNQVSDGNSDFSKRDSQTTGRMRGRSSVANSEQADQPKQNRRIIKIQSKGRFDNQTIYEGIKK